MSDASTTSTTSTPPQATPQGNSPEARNPDGSLKTNPPAQPSTPQQAKSDTTPDPAKTDDKKTDVKPDDKAGDKKAAATVPEKYEFKAPEGRELDTKLVEAVTPVFKELGLTQDQANKLYDFWNANANKSTEALVNTYEDVRKGWRNEVINDKTLGNGKDGPSAETSQNVSAIFQSLDTKAATELRNALDLTGAGDHPAMVRALNEVGKLLREGTSVRGKNPSPLGQQNPSKAPPSLAAAMFPNLPSSGA